MRSSADFGDAGGAEADDLVDAGLLRVWRRPTAADFASRRRTVTPRLMRFDAVADGLRRGLRRLIWPGAASRVISAAGVTREVAAEGVEDAAELRGREEAGGSAAEVDGVDAWGR